MDKNVTMQRRFSLNMSHLPHPIAESTCVNLNGHTGVGNSSNGATGQFRWGGSPISPKNRSNSSICLNNTSAMHKNRGTATSPQRARMNLSKIDPRIYADVQSRGLVSRIVQYHENGARLNRSMSASNLYSKSGKSPMAHLQKSELPYRATQQNVSMTRIAPPKKSVFYGNTLSSLLRSNSVISLQKSDDEISCENRPILHPPATENELAPTRSVLDVLKEISRKRINSDDTNGLHDANKKYCNRDCNDAPSYEQSTPTTELRNMSMQGFVAAAMPVASTQSHKRQREHHVVAPTQQQPLHYTHHLNSNNNTLTVISGRPPLQAQHSPEQIAKKRICSYNNDITSSLSSSLIHANKRKFYEQQRANTLHFSPTTAFDEYEIQKSKIQRQQTDLRFQQLTKSLSCNTPIIPLPTTPLNQSLTIPAVARSIENTTEPTADASAAVKRTVSEPPLINSKLASKPEKPKLTLFNRNYNELTKLNGTEETFGENGNDLDDGECADIQFVKPKKSTAIVNKKNPLIERTQKSKLAMMLSGLRGEIYQGEEGDDEVDKNAKRTNKTAVTKESPVVIATSSTATTNTTTAATNFTMKAPEKSVENVVGANAISAKAATTSANSNASTVSTPTTTNTFTTLSSFKLISPAVTSTNSVATNAVTSTTTSPVAKATSPLVGLKLTPPKPALSFGGNTANTATVPTFSFGATSATNSAANKTVAGTIATGVGAVPQLQGFSFGATTKNNTAAAASTTTTTTTVTLANTAATSTTIATTTAAGGFSFSTAPKVATAAPTLTAPTTTTVAAASAFGSFANSIAASSTPATTAATKPAFAFGAPAVNTTTIAAVVKPTFNFGGSATAAATTAATAFTAAGAGTFTFGGAANRTTAATTTVNQTAATATQPPNLFGTPSNTFSAPTAAPAKSFTFGAAASAAQSATTTATSATFSFGAPASATTNATAPATSTTNLFSFGGGQQSAAVTSTTASATNATPFSFGAPAQKPAATTLNTTNANTNEPTFSFGGATAANTANPLSAAANTNASSNNLFAFGAKSAASESKLFGNNSQPAAATSTQSSAFTFGAIASQAATPVFGSAVSTASSPAAFGAASTTSTMPFAFGGSNINKPVPVSSTPTGNSAAAGGLSFGATAAAGATTSNSTTTANIFGGTTAAIPVATGIAKPAFNFGGGAAASNTNGPPKSIFGGGATKNATGNASVNNTFGGLAAASSNQTTKTFNFGDNAANSNNATVNPFAAAVSNPSAGGFTFAANTTINKPAATAANHTPFAFGAAANTGGAGSAATSTPFNFGSSNSVGAPANKTFSFGSNGNLPAATTTNASSLFGGVANAQQSTSVTPFSFSAGNTAAVAPTTAANIFALPATPAGASSGSGDRPFRRATRRLQKT